MQRSLLLAGGLIALTAVSGCSSSSTQNRSFAPSPATTPSEYPSAVTPTAATTSAATPTPTSMVTSRPTPARETPAPLRSAVTAPGAAGLPMCTNGQLQAVLASVSAGSAGDQAAFVELRNNGTAACRLQGQPTVQMLAESGTPLRTVETLATLYREAPVALPVGTPPLQPGALVEGHAYLAVIFNPVHDTAGAMCSPPDVTSPAGLSVALPAGSVTVDATAADGSGKRVQACRGQLRVSVFASRGTAATQ